MKTEAYTCDLCGSLVHAEESIGINPDQDMFNILDSYVSTLRPEKHLIHHCITCYNKKVVAVAEREVNRKKDEHLYVLKIKELHYMVKKQCVENYNKKMKNKVAQVKKK